MTRRRALLPTLALAVAFAGPLAAETRLPASAAEVDLSFAPVVEARTRGPVSGGRVIDPCLISAGQSFLSSRSWRSWS